MWQMKLSGDTVLVFIDKAKKNKDTFICLYAYDCVLYVCCSVYFEMCEFLLCEYLECFLYLHFIFNLIIIFHR